MKKLIFGLLATFCGLSHAALVSVSGVPTTWLLQNYVPGNVVVWYTGSACTSGQLTLPTSATAADHARLYATVMSAKASNSKIFVYYENSVAGCPISSFGFQ